MVQVGKGRAYDTFTQGQGLCFSPVSGVSKRVTPLVQDFCGSCVS